MSPISAAATTTVERPRVSNIFYGMESVERRWGQNRNGVRTPAALSLFERSETSAAGLADGGFPLSAPWRRGVIVFKHVDADAAEGSAEGYSPEEEKRIVADFSGRGRRSALFFRFPERGFANPSAQNGKPPASGRSSRPVTNASRTYSTSIGSPIR